MFHVCEIGRIGYLFTCAIRVRCGGRNGCGAITIAFCFVIYVFHDCDSFVSGCGREESANGGFVNSRKKLIMYRGNVQTVKIVRQLPE